MSAVFLNAEWRDLLMLNYEVDPALLLPFVPSGTELDRWQDRVFLSLVAFRFLHTRVFGLTFPFHRNFEEINLRFYVRRVEGDEIKRGVVFIGEIVPRAAIAMIARAFYNENYRALPMTHRIDRDNGVPAAVEYAWKSVGQWNRMRARLAGSPALPVPGSQEEFIAEHYWGYAAQPDGGCVEYRVAHQQWKVWQCSAASFEAGADEIYGPAFAAALAQPPASAFVAEGSPVVVYRGRRIGSMALHDFSQKKTGEWILYDNQCGFCSRWVRFWQPTLAKRGIGIAGLQEPWVVERLPFNQQELLHDIRLLREDNSHFSGADVYLQAARQIWWAWPFYAVFSLPGFNHFLHFGYRWFARNRHRISQACKLESPAQPDKRDDHPRR